MYGWNKLGVENVLVHVSKTVDNKTRLQALTLINDCNKYKIDLTTNGVVVTDAIKICPRANGTLTKQKKHYYKISKKRMN